MYLIIVIVLIGFVCVDALHPSQQFFNHAVKISCLPGRPPSGTFKTLRNL